MGVNICMFGCLASSGVESMNQANKIVPYKTAVDILNAALLLLKLEGEGYSRWNLQVWNHDQVLTPKRMDLMRDAFVNVDPRDYKMSKHEDNLNFEITVRKNLTGAKNYLVTLPKEKRLGSHFGTCTCGVPSKEGVPGKHMVAIVKSAMFEGMKRTDIMPYFWMTDRWKRQYDLASQHNTEIGEITTVKKACTKNELL
jgi:hypothetical protein